ncbi:zinc-dependent metalloprotease [soil metagenome]
MQHLLFRKPLTALALAAGITFFSPSAGFAQLKKKDRKPKKEKAAEESRQTPVPVYTVEAPPTKPAPDARSIAGVVARTKKHEGLFTLYQDTTDGSAYILVKKEQLGKEYIYTSTVVDGLADIGLFRGSFRDNMIFKISRHFNKLEFVQENLNFYFDPASALSRAADANVLRSILSSHTIVAKDEAKGEYLIKADELFLTEYLSQVKTAFSNPLMPPRFSLGMLNREKSKYLKLKNYPLNTDVVVEYVYDNPSPSMKAGNEVADSRYVSIKMQHSLLEMPKNSFTPRFDDPRVGFFTTQSTDMTSKSATPYRDVIHRWHLEKKDSSAALSEPVEPIVFWIENTTPVELRETIRRAALSWNYAFEKAGFRNAIRVEVQPDDADWDAGDIRYNVLRWTSSPKPPFGGYGPSFVNPRTGQIIGADIMLEYVFLTNRLNQERLFDVAAMPAQEHLDHQDKHLCSLGHHLQLTTQFGMAALNLIDDEVELKERESYLNSSLYYLVLHEIGHTLGLNHNMRSSQMLSPTDLADKMLAMDRGLTGSVMDYPAANISLDKKKQGLYFTSKPGPYDLWAIEFAYSPALEEEAAEKARLAKILARSTEPELAFGNDADDMRFPGKGIDPRVMIGDMSSDAIQYATDRIVLAADLTRKLKGKYAAKTDQSYHELRNSYLVLTGEINTSAGVISRYVGGVYVDRSLVGQSETAKPFTPVSYQDQKRAMQALNQHIFSPAAVSAPTDLFNYLQMQRRGFSGGNEDPQIHDRVPNIQKNVLGHLLHPAVLKRVTDSEQYGNRYKLAEMMGDLTTGMFKADLRTSVNSYRQNLQAEYVNRLISVAGLEGRQSYDYAAQSMAFYNLKTIRQMLVANPGTDITTKAHRQHLVFQIDKALKEKA